MGINWVGGGGVIGGGGFTAALGYIVAAAFIIHYWWVFAMVALALVILHLLYTPKPQTELQRKATEWARS